MATEEVEPSPSLLSGDDRAMTRLSDKAYCESFAPLLVECVRRSSGAPETSERARFLCRCSPRLLRAVARRPESLTLLASLLPAPSVAGFLSVVLRSRKASQESVSLEVVPAVLAGLVGKGVSCELLELASTLIRFDSCLDLAGMAAAVARMAGGLGPLSRSVEETGVVQGVLRVVGQLLSFGKAGVVSAMRKALDVMDLAALCSGAWLRQELGLFCAGVEAIAGLDQNQRYFGRLASEVQGGLRLMQTLAKDCSTMVVNHFDVEEVLRCLGSLLMRISGPQGKLSAYFLSSPTMHLASSLVQCMNNVDENLNQRACTLAHYWLQLSDSARRDFVESSGIGSLHGLACDYLPLSKSYALRVLSLLANSDVGSTDNSVTLWNMQSAGLIKVVAQELRVWTSDDATSSCDAAACEACLLIVARASKSEAGLRKVLVSEGVPDVLSRLLCEASLTPCAKERPITEAAIAALSNLCVAIPEVQEGMGKSRVIPWAVSALKAGNGTASSISPAILLVFLSNAVATNHANQTAFAESGGCAVLVELIVSSCSLSPDLLAASCLYEACALLSHVSWNHDRCKSELSNRDLFSALDSLISSKDLDHDMDPAAQLEKFLSEDADSEDSPTLRLPENMVSVLLVALTNLCYNNAKAQSAVIECRIIRSLVLLCNASLGLHEQCMLSMCALANIVCEAPDAQRSAIRAGLVECLVSVLETEEDDDSGENVEDGDDQNSALQKQAFQTLVQLGEPGVRRLVELLRGYTLLLQDRREDLRHSLELVLAVLNGVLYSVGLLPHSLLCEIVSVVVAALAQCHLADEARETALRTILSALTSIVPESHKEEGPPPFMPSLIDALADSSAIAGLCGLSLVLSCIASATKLVGFGTACLRLDHVLASALSSRNAAELRGVAAEKPVDFSMLETALDTLSSLPSASVLPMSSAAATSLRERL